jgi:hypothetical protein
MRRIGFASDESGATVTEHAIVVCVMALVIVYAVGSGLSPSEALRRIKILSDVVFTDEPAAPTTQPRAIQTDGSGMSIREQDVP